jgi:hypothetical protein
MAITITEVVDFLQKKLLFGVTKTGLASAKFGSNESIPSPLVVYPENIWGDSLLIPAVTPLENASGSVVAVYAGIDRIKMTADPTAALNETWLATSTFGTPASRMTDFIPPTKGTGYAARVFIGDPAVGPAARLFPDAPGEEWLFDYTAGVLNFPSAVPAPKTASIGSGTVNITTNGIYVEAYRYIGRKGLGGGDGGLPEDLGTMAFQDSDNVDITGGTISGVTFTNVTIDGGTF